MGLDRKIMKSILQQYSHGGLKMSEEYIPDGLLALAKEAALENFCDNAELLDEMLQYFADGMPEKLKTLKAAIAAKDYAVWASTAHMVKGEAATLCLQRINAIALKLEMAGKRQEPADAEAMLAVMEKEMQAFTGVLQKK
jgi:HPt (histidine-containing phosphotransfer) domain-containing protein